MDLKSVDGFGHLFSRLKFFLMQFNLETFLHMTNTVVLLFFKPWMYISHLHPKFIIYLVLYNFSGISYAIL